MVELDIGFFGGDETAFTLLFIDESFLHEAVQSPSYGDAADIEMFAHFFLGRYFISFSKLTRLDEGAVVIDDMLVSRQCLHVIPPDMVLKIHAMTFL